jgi:hypothetical protein
MLRYEGKHINAKGMIVRSELSGIDKKADEGKVTIYSAGILFKDASAGQVKDFLDSIENNKKTQVPEHANWFYRDILFSITTPKEKVLNLTKQFGIKDVSQSGVIIQTDHKLKTDSIVLMELSLKSYDPACFMGRVVSCRMKQDGGYGKYDIRVEFLELTDRDRSLIISVIDRVSDKENAGAGW